MTIPTPDGHAISALHETCGAPRAVLLCHGIAADKDARGIYASFAQSLTKNGFDSLRFDFRGHGDSAIAPADASIAGMTTDLEAALAYLAGRYTRVHLLAASFGASVALLLARRVPLDSLQSICFWNPVTDYASTFTAATMPWAKAFFPQGGLDAALRACPIPIPDREFQFGRPLIEELYALSPSETRLPADVPVLVLHGTDDELVNPDDSARYVRNQERTNVELVMLDQCGHGLEGKLRDVFRMTREFFERCDG